MSSGIRWAATAAVLGLAVASAPGALGPQAARASAVAQPAVSVAHGAGEHALVRFRLPDQAALDRLTASDADVAAVPHHSPDQVLADVVVDSAQLATMVDN